MDKYYLTDMGIGRIRSSGFKLEMGALLENVIYNELISRSDIPDNYPKYVISFDKMDFSRDGIVHKNVIDFLLEEPSEVIS